MEAFARSLKRCSTFTKPLRSWGCSDPDACAVHLGAELPAVRAGLCPPRSPPSQASLLGLLLCSQVNHSTDSLQLDAFVGAGEQVKLVGTDAAPRAGTLAWGSVDGRPQGSARTLCLSSVSFFSFCDDWSCVAAFANVPPG